MITQQFGSAAGGPNGPGRVVVDIGQRVRSARLYRGMSIKTLAGLTGMSVGWLSEVETGKRTVDRRSHFAALAEALHVSVTDLTGQPMTPVNRVHSQAHASVPAIRTALMVSSLENPPDLRPRPLAQARDDVIAAGRLGQACDYAVLGEVLPDLLSQLHVLAADPDPQRREEALRLLATACHAAYMLLKTLGYMDLAWMSAERYANATARLGDPVWLAMSDFLRVHLLLPAGEASAAARLCEIGSRRLEGRTGESAAAQLYGMFHLSSAYAATVQGGGAAGGRAADHLAEASQLAGRLGEGDAFNLFFGPANVAIWKVAIGVEAGEGPKVVEHVRGVDVGVVASKGRQANLYADLGRGLAQGRHHESEAVAMLRRAEDLAPQWVPSDPLLHQTVTSLLARARAVAGGRELRGLAYRMGVA
jgi:transcriptional regulator with XRE-family HTH domain